MSELPKAYDPRCAEEKWQKIWKEKKFFIANASSDKKPYSIVLPPPNVTGVLHMGHALGDTLQDILIRYHRMRGFEVLWVPGTDHAGIATQTVVERHLIEKEGKRRKDYAREEFLQHVWEWKERSEERILQQMERVGCSLDFTRLRFTMDEKSNLAVRTVFKKMYDEGLIYQGDYLVNWDPMTQTALADDEVDFEEKESHLWYFKYPVEGTNDHILIATTRPETMLGDTAVAVSQKDPRYTKLIGKQIRLPITDRLIPIIADHYVDPDFGSGAVKITPAHDPNDFEIGLRHDLPMINIMTSDGKIEEGFFAAGETMDSARAHVVAEMKKLGLLEKIDPHTHRVGHSYRSKAEIQPYLSKQWFVKMSGFKEKLKKAPVKLLPDWEKTYLHWIDNLRDWCISRQLWWGHRIPIWYHVDDPEKKICFAGEGLPPEVAKNPEKWVQDEDVLDTWFSSALWPFSTLGWPEKTPDLAKFYPNSTLVTGHDILFFWVARMILMGECAMGEVPFPETFIHGLIYGKSYWRKKEGGGIAYVSQQERIDFDLGKPIPKDVTSKWEKMSKSKGNVIDPIEIIDLYGADAMRMALTSSVTNLPQIDLDRRKFEEFKNFANKVWNASRFVLSHAPQTLSSDLDLKSLQLEDRWILSRLNRIIASTQKQIATYEFANAAMNAYHFFWDEFCAYYVEISKPYLFGKAGTESEQENKKKLLTIILSNCILLLHPIVPHITEEIFSLLPKASGDFQDPYCAFYQKALSSPAACMAPFPTQTVEKDICDIAEAEFAKVQEILHAIRNIRAEMQLPPNVATDIYIEGDANLPYGTILRALVRINQLHLNKPEELTFSANAQVKELKITIPLPAELIEREKLRLEKEREKLEIQISKLEGQLKNENFVARAPKDLVEKTKADLVSAQKELHEILSRRS